MESVRNNPKNKQGWLEKTGGKTQVMKKFQKRWVVLSADKKLVEYFETETNDTNARSGFIDLALATNISVSSGNLFSIETKDRTFQFRAPTNEEAQEWVFALVNSKDYVPAPPKGPPPAVLGVKMGVRKDSAVTVLTESKPSKPNRRSGILSKPPISEADEDGGATTKKKNFRKSIGKSSEFTELLEESAAQLAQITDLRSQLSQVTAELETSKKDFESKDLACDEALSKLKALEKTLKSRDVQIELLHKKENDTKEEIATLTKKLNDQEKLSSTVPEKDQQIASLRDSLKKRDEELKLLKEKLDNTTRAFDDLQRSSSGGQAEWIQEKTQLAGEIINKDDQIKKLKLQIQDRDELNEKLMNQNKEIVHLNDQIKEKSQTFTSEKDSLNTQLYRKDEEIKTYRTQLNEKQTIVDSFEHTLKSRDLALQEKDNSLRQMKDVLTEKEKRIATLLELSSTQTSKHSDSTSGDALENEQRRCREALIKVAAKEEELNTKTLDISNLRSQLDRLQLQLDEEKRKAEKGKEAHTAHTNELEANLRKVIEDKEHKITQLESLLVQAREAGPPPSPFMDSSPAPPPPFFGGDDGGPPSLGLNDTLDYDNGPPPFSLDMPPENPFNESLSGSEPPPPPFSPGANSDNFGLKNSFLSLVNESGKGGVPVNMDPNATKELDAKIRSLLVETNSLHKLVEAKDEKISKLERSIQQQLAAIGNIVEIEAQSEKIKSKLIYKDSVIDDLKKQLIARKRELGYLADDGSSITIDKKYETVVSSLREELTVKEKTLEDLYAKLNAKEDHLSDIEKQSMKIEELDRTVSALTEELSLRKEQQEATELLVSTLKDDFANAYNRGNRANKAIKAEFETNLHKAEINIKHLEQRVDELEKERDVIQLELRKSERVNASARKVANIERNFLDVIKKIENKRKEKKLALDKNMKERMEQDNEEKKSLRTKIKILKEEYNKLNEKFQAAQALKQELDAKKQECDSLKLKVKQLSSVSTPISNSPRIASASVSESPAQSLTGTPNLKPPGPIIVGPAGPNFNRNKSMSKWGNNPVIQTPAEPPIQEAPPIIIQPSSPQAAPSSGGPAKWSSVKTNKAKEI